MSTPTPPIETVKHTPSNAAEHRNAWQVVQAARHADRPLFLDYVNALFDDVDFLAGDRLFAEDQALLGGLARFEGAPVVIMGQHKGRTTRERLKHNFGMANPEGYRKALRLATLAERFNLPIITFIDTNGAFPGKDAEERGQSEAIAQCLALFAHIKVPVINIIIGEGGSGGALAIGVGDHLMMLSNSIYSVITPEGCASILWKTSTKAEQASEALALTAERLYALGLIDEIIDEQAGAHINPEVVMQALRVSIAAQLSRLTPLPAEQRCHLRYQKLMTYDSTGLSRR